MKRKTFFIFSVFWVLVLCGCDRSPELQKMEGKVQGTSYHFSWWSSGRVDSVKLKASIEATFADIDKQISNYRNDSDIELFNHNPSVDWQELPADVVDLLQIAQRVYKGSAGCYDPTVKPLFDLWGFRKGTFHIPSPEQREAVRAYVGFDKVQLDVPGHRVRKMIPDLSIDMSSMGEGYTVWRLAKVFEEVGVTNYLLEIGGDMYVRGTRPDREKWRVAIVRPLPEEITIQKTVDINDDKGVALNTSGTYRHYFDAEGRRYSHIFDPRVGAPVTHDLVSATVIGDDPRLTDAWATAMLCMGKTAGDKAANQYQVGVFFIQQQETKLLESMSSSLEKNKAISLQ
jgi:FAD:protein FMN transferase